jgi:hypothetical protein
MLLCLLLSRQTLQQQLLQCLGSCLLQAPLLAVLLLWLVHHALLLQ